MINNTDIDELIKEIEKFQKEDTSTLMNEHVCKNCKNISKNLEVKKIESCIDEIKEFQKIVDEHNSKIKTKHTIFGSKPSDKKWEVAHWLNYIVIRNEGETGWINPYQIPFFNRICYVTCPICKVRNSFLIGVSK